MLTILRQITKRACMNPKRKFHSTFIVRNSLTNYSLRSTAAIGSFPLVRLFFVVVYRIARPLANEMVLRAQKNTLFREYLCIPLGRTIHWMDMKVRIRILNLGKLNLVPKIDDKIAMDLGAQLLLEFIVIIIFSVIVIYQYNESVQKEEKKDAKRKKESNEVIENIKQIELVAQNNQKHIDALNILLNAIRPLVK